MSGYHCSVPVISTGMVFRPSVSDRAPSPHLPPPVSSAVRRDLFGGFASMLLLVPTEAGAIKAGELDRELLACCAEAEASDRAAMVTMDVVETMDADNPDMTSALLHIRTEQDHTALAASLARDVAGRTWA